MSRAFFRASAIVVLVTLPAVQAAAKDSAPTSFPTTSIRFEQNVTDEDVEVVFEIVGGDEGLSKLTVVAPDGRTVVDVSAPVASTLGMRKFLFESPEPKVIEKLKAAYPEGIYTFTGTTASGSQLHGSATLTHGLPPTAAFLKPQPDANGVAIRNMAIAWKAVANTTTYIVEIEEEGRDVSFVARLPASTTQLAVPDGFLLPGTEYKLAIGAVTKEGNASFIETSFTTAAGK